MKLKALVAAALMCAGSAFAAVDSATWYTDVDGGAFSFTLGDLTTTSVGDTINLSFDFYSGAFATLGPSGLTFVLASLPGSSSVAFGSGTVAPTAGGSTSVGSFPFTGTLSHYSASFTPATVGTFGIVVSGFNAGAGQVTALGNATGSVTAVPEPETYAMMLAGLGAIGFMARRRQANK